MSYIIETKDLNYSFGEFQAIKNLDLQVQENSIYGFLGPNGAGKTTTIKIILGLLRSLGNNVNVFDMSINKNRIDILSKVGTLIENPSVYSHLTASENLLVTTKLLGIKKKRIDEVLKITGLLDVKNKKAGKFSMGMKQRLGISKALLSDPQLIILDEPTNGLDPAGIVEIRNLIVRLKEYEGKSIFLSSHLLSEIEKMCTHVGIINKGELLFQGSISELQDLNSNKLHIRCSQPETVSKFFTEKNIDFEMKENNIFSISAFSDNETASIIKQLIKLSVDIYSIENHKLSLEELFIKITG